MKAAAEFHGIQTEYIDVNGETKYASIDSIRAVLIALSSDYFVDVDFALNRMKFFWGEEQYLAPIQVAWDGKLRFVDISLPSNFVDGSIEYAVYERNNNENSLKSGSTKLTNCTVLKKTSSDDTPYVMLRIELGWQLNYGYFELRIQLPHRLYRTTIISAPEVIAATESKKSWGAFAPLYAIHSSSDWGIGDFGMLGEMAEWVGERGGNILGTLPLDAAFLDNPCEHSPYSPASRLFWNEIYLNIEDIPELKSCPKAKTIIASKDFQQEISKLKSAKMIDYKAVMRSKRTVLQLISDEITARNLDRSAQIDKSISDYPEVDMYAKFRAVTEAEGKEWQNWDSVMKDGYLIPEEYNYNNYRYYLFVQHESSRQLKYAKSRANNAGVDLYLDMPLGVNPSSYDVWKNQSLFVTGLSVGAPPDKFFTAGQDWGFHPLNPHMVRYAGYEYVSACLKSQMKYADVLRLDHVMSNHRLYVIPKGFSALDGVYLRYKSDEWWAVICLEAHLNQCQVIGENLGIVPPEVISDMNRHQVSGMHVLQCEPKTESEEISSNTVASINTHDMPTLAGYWHADDIEDRRDLGLINETDGYEHEIEQRTEELAGMLNMLGIDEDAKTIDLREVLTKSISQLAKSDARRLLINLEDLWLETKPQNVPGTVSERPNWRRKMKLSFEEIMSSDEIKRILKSVKR